MSGERWFPDSMPLPAASRETLPWWQAAAQHQLVVQRCENCGRYRHPPSPLCPYCRNWAASFREHPGTGTIYTFTKVHQPFLPDLALPYVIAVIDLDGLEADHVRLVTNIVDAEPDQVAIGARVELVWEDMGPDLSLPRARLTGLPVDPSPPPGNRASLRPEIAHFDARFREGGGKADRG